MAITVAQLLSVIPSDAKVTLCTDFAEFEIKHNDPVAQELFGDFVVDYVLTFKENEFSISIKTVPVKQDTHNQPAQRHFTRRSQRRR
jgi:hypothetical protein